MGKGAVVALLAGLSASTVWGASSWEAPAPAEQQMQSFGRLGISHYYSSHGIEESIGRWVFEVTGSTLSFGYCRLAKGEAAFSDQSFMPTFASQDRLPIRAPEGTFTFGGDLKWPHEENEIPYQWQLILGTPTRYEETVEKNYKASIPLPAAVWLVSCGILCLVGLKRKS